jgi:hypothetical protein
MGAIHHLKCWPAYFADIRAGRKPFEVRWNDRGYAVGDVLVLKEFDPVAGDFTGEIEARVVSCLFDDVQFGVQRGYVVLGFAPPAPQVREAPPADADELELFHIEMAVQARLRADNWRRSAGEDDGEAATRALPKGPTDHGRHRYLACADLAEVEARDHEATVALIRQLREAAGV